MKFRNLRDRLRTCPIQKPVGYATEPDIAHPALADDDPITIRLDEDADYILLIDSHGMNESSMQRLSDWSAKLSKSLNRQIVIMAVLDPQRSVRFVEVPKKQQAPVAPTPRETDEVTIT